MTLFQIACIAWIALLVLWVIVPVIRGSRCDHCKSRNIESYGWHTHDRCLDCGSEL